MFCVEVSEEKMLLITDAVKAEVNTELEAVQFFGIGNELVSLYKLKDIKGFFKMDKRPERIAGMGMLNNDVTIV